MTTRASGTASLERHKRNISSYKKSNLTNNNTSDSIERNLLSKHKVRTREEIVEEVKTEYFGEKDNYYDVFSTSQLDEIDFSKFENHVFYDSAVSKVQYAYTKILNEYPYDGSEYDFKQYISSLDGYTSYVYENLIPKNKGYLKFDGENQVYIDDKTGNILQDFIGEHKKGLIDLNRNKFCFEFWLYSLFEPGPDSTQQKQIIFQKKINSNGITIWLDNFRKNLESYSSNDFLCDINIIINNNQNYTVAKFDIEVNKFNHININFINYKNKRKILSHVNSIPKTVDQTGVFSITNLFDDNFLKTNAIIGNGNNHLNDYENIIKTSGFIGYIDDFKFYTNSRKREEIISGMLTTEFSNRYLKLYYKFNEPSGNYLNNHIVLDHSGNRCHGLILNSVGEAYSSDIVSIFRELNSLVPTPIVYEDENFSPVLFPNYEETLRKQNEILSIASKYDNQNPNIFYNFFPKYYFVEQSDTAGINDIYISKEEVTIDKNKKIELLGVKKTSNNYLIELLLIWARFFDQLKCYVDHLTSILENSYDDINEKKISSVLLPYAIKQFGFKFEEIFPKGLTDKLYSKNLQYDKDFSEKTIRHIQNNLWKRFLINSQDIIRSKGTINSIKSIFNSFGLEADLFLNIREYNSQNKINLYENFTNKLSSLKCIDFLEKSIINTDAEYENNSIYPSNRIMLESILYNSDDTSKTYFKFYKEFCFESYIKFDHNKVEKYDYLQSIIRVDNESHYRLRQSHFPILNLVFIRKNKKSKSGTLSLYINENSEDINSETTVLSIENIDLMSGKIFYIAIVKKISQTLGETSEYELIATTSDYLSKNESIKKNSVKINTNNTSNLSNCSIRIGNILNYTDQTKEDLNYSTNFEGKYLKLRVWSRALLDSEVNIHKTCIDSIGEENLLNSSNNLEININLKEKITLPYTNTYSLYNDISKSNNIEFKIKLNNKVHKDFLQSFDHIIFKQSDIIDMPNNYNRVNINSLDNRFLSQDLNLTTVNPSYSTLKNFNYYEDIRLSIDFSTAKFINEEISKIILVHDFYTNMLGNTSSLYEENYQDLTNLRNVFYSKIEKEVNIKSLYHIYKFFDNILEKLLYDVIPSKVHYHGFNFVVESNIGERNKYVHKMSESRFGVTEEFFDITPFIELVQSDIIEDDNFLSNFNSRNYYNYLRNQSEIARKVWR